MARRRMLSSDIIGSDMFIALPSTSQALYLHLNQDADDDGFNNRVTLALMKAHAQKKDLAQLEEKNLIIQFDSGVIVIRHWRCHNYIRKDTYNETSYKAEKSTLTMDTNNAYIIAPSTNRQQSVDETLTQVSIGKVSIGKSSIDKNKIIRHKYGEYKNVLLSDDELKKLKNTFPDDYEERIEEMSAAIEMYGYKYKSHYLAILKWEKNAQEKKAGAKTESVFDFAEDFLRGEDNGKQ